MKKMKPALVLCLLTSIAAVNCFAGACPDFSGKYLAAACDMGDTSRCRIGDSDFPALSKVSAKDGEIIGIRQNGCESLKIGEVEIPLNEPGMKTSFNRNSWRVKGSRSYSGDVGHGVSAKGRKSSAWGISNKSEGKIELFSSCTSLGLFGFIPVVKSFKATCSLTKIK